MSSGKTEHGKWSGNIMISISKVPYKRIRIFLNPQLFGRSWAKYRDLSVASISIGWGKKIYLLDTDKSRYFAITDIGLITVLSFDDRVFFCFLIIRQKICHFHARAMARRRKAWIHLRMSRILFAAKHS